MKDWFLIPLVVGFFLLGYPVMGRLDRFLERRRQAAPDPSPLRISVESAVMNPAVVGRLNAFSRAHPEADVLFSCGPRQQLIHQLATGKIDVALVYPTEEAMPSNLQKQYVVLPCDASKIGVPIQPIPSGRWQVTLELLSHINPEEHEAASQLDWFLTSAS